MKVCEHAIHWNDINVKRPDTERRCLVKLTSKQYGTSQIESADYNMKDERFVSTLLNTHGHEYDVVAWADYV